MKSVGPPANSLHQPNTCRSARDVPGSAAWCLYTIFKSMRVFLTVILALLATGCDTINLQQYRVAAASESDTAKVRQVLGSIAAQTGLEDRTSTSFVPHTLVFYTQPKIQHFRVDLGAREVAQDIVIDLNAGFGPMVPEFKKARALLTPVLSNEFGPRLTIVPLGKELIPITFK